VIRWLVGCCGVIVGGYWVFPFFFADGYVALDRGYWQWLLAKAKGNGYWQRLEAMTMAMTESYGKCVVVWVLLNSV
jgi:hypothetical protein